MSANRKWPQCCAFWHGACSENHQSMLDNPIALLHCTMWQEGRGGKVEVFLTAADGAPNPTPAPVYPTAGTHLVPLKRVSS